MSTEHPLWCRTRDACLHENPALVQLLGLCPLMAVSTTLAAALGLGLATLAVMLLSAVMISALRRWIPEIVRLPMMIVLIAGTTTLVLMVLQAFAFDLYQRLALYLQIIVTNCTILARMETTARRENIAFAAADAFGAGIGFLGPLLLIGALREWFGRGTLGADLNLILGTSGDFAFSWPVHLRLFSLPAGGFILLGVLVALFNRLRVERPISARLSDVSPRTEARL